MKNLGFQICEDGITEYRSNGICIERRFLYRPDTGWESVAFECCLSSQKAFESECKRCGYGYAKTIAEAEAIYKTTNGDAERIRSEAAAALGRIKTAKKAAAAKENGKKGGRPKKQKQ